MFASFGVNSGERQYPLDLVISFADSLSKGQLVRLGWVRSDIADLAVPSDTRKHDRAKDSVRWLRAKASAQYSEILLAVLYVAASHFGLCGCIGARIGRAVSSVEGILECSHTFIWWWHTDRPQQYWYYQATGNGRVKLTDVFGKDDRTRCSFV